METTTSWGLDRTSYCRSCGSKYSLGSPRFRIVIFQLFLVTCVSPNEYAACLRVEYLSGWPLQSLPNMQIFLQPCLSALPMVFNYHDHCGWQSSPIFWLMYLFLITTTISRTETMLSHFFSLPLSWSLGLQHLSPPWMWSPTLLFLFFTFQGGFGRKISLILECCLKLQLCSAKCQHQQSTYNVIATQIIMTAGLA